MGVVRLGQRKRMLMLSLVGKTGARSGRMVKGLPLLRRVMGRRLISVLSRALLGRRRLLGRVVDIVIPDSVVALQRVFDT